MRERTVAILGAGVAGLCMGIRLGKAGIPYTIYEKSDRLGGTWYDNTYPGCACDVPSHLYSYSFEPKTDWSRKFSPQSEIQGYLEHCADEYAVWPHIRFETEIVSATFDDSRGSWRLRTRGGDEVVADVLVSGLGQLNRPHVPDLPGLASFDGTTFHSARWNHAQDLTGKRVGVIGNAASAVQLVPEIAPQVARLHVFQRTANWIFPRLDAAYSERAKWLFAHVPLLERLYRWWIYWRLELNFLGMRRNRFMSEKMQKLALGHLHAQVADPGLREALTPDYPIGCKRILIIDDYYPALQRPNVELVTSGIERIEPDAVVTSDGARHVVDTLIFATGFQTTGFLEPLVVEGRGGAKLRDAWREGAEAHLGLTVAGFPNLFLLYGPNTNLGHNSIIFMIECQVNYALRCIQELRRRDLAWLDVRREAMEASNARLQRDLAKTAWAGGCASWYKTASGKITNNWSGPTVAYWWRTLRPNFSEYLLQPRA
jgi:cation diffusion facilitator CzcD-associated flavoprotein CzcO